jgi:hypothetical protein
MCRSRSYGVVSPSSDLSAAIVQYRHWLEQRAELLARVVSSNDLFGCVSGAHHVPKTYPRTPRRCVDRVFLIFIKDYLTIVAFLWGFNSPFSPCIAFPNQKTITYWRHLCYDNVTLSPAATQVEEMIGPNRPGRWLVTIAPSVFPSIWSVAVYGLCCSCLSVGVSAPRWSRCRCLSCIKFHCAGVLCNFSETS